MVRKLLAGHQRFIDHIGHEREFLRQLVDRQQPAALFVGCSDSRVIPELLTSSRPGDLFVVRNVANVVPPADDRNASVGAAIEYAVGVLRVPHVVVCGHYGCGGVKAALDGIERLHGAPSLQAWLEGVVPAVAEARQLVPEPATHEEDLWRAAVERNVIHQLVHLVTHPVVSEAMEAGRLQLHGWIYDIASLGLLVYDGEQNRFVGAPDLLRR